MPITSILDTDFYKLTMRASVIKHYPKVNVKYKFTNRNQTMKFNDAAFKEINDAIENMSKLELTKDEFRWLYEYEVMTHGYLDTLKKYRFNPKQINISLTDGNLAIDIDGPWQETILWEVPLMAVISEAYFNNVDTDWKTNNWKIEQNKKINGKIQQLTLQGNPVSDFGTRRRRSYEVQDLVVKAFKDSKMKNFAGTSNVHFAHKYDLTATGTAAHEYTMGISVLEGLRHANRFALNKWNETFHGKLGIALTDTFGTDAFFKDFDHKLASLYDGVRHDSACPFVFTDKIVNHYKELGIDPKFKTIVFSDSLDVDRVAKLADYCKDKIKCSFGIGTHLTNDFENSKALNMVIKLSSVEGVPVVKLSDDIKKATGDKDALRVAKWTFFGQPLDA